MRYLINHLSKPNATERPEIENNVEYLELFLDDLKELSASK